MSREVEAKQTDTCRYDEHQDEQSCHCPATACPYRRIHLGNLPEEKTREILEDNVPISPNVQSSSPDSEYNSDRQGPSLLLQDKVKNQGEKEFK